ncbi:MAG TPA: DNA alkylation repair protein, partial [Chloroflexota bacterium]|nr:DNA alkylation repair protein [Chloroflexota bacterium]
MKSPMRFLGVTAAPLRAVCRRVFAEYPLEERQAWEAAIRELWFAAEYREERYAALELAGASRYKAHRTLEMLPLWEELIVSGAWWDLVDGLASHEVGELVRDYPERMKHTMLAWAGNRDLWKRRTAIICQIGSKDATDLELLYGAIEPNRGDTTFWIRKAIGWALRSYAWTNPDEVRRYVAEHEAGLSGLSKREALVNLSGA